MDRKDRFGTRSDRPLDRRGIHGEGAWIDVDQHWLCARVLDGGDAGHESKRHRDDFIASSNARGQQSKMQRAGAGIQRYAFRSSAIPGKVLFKSGYFRAQDELAAVEHSLQGSIDFLLDATVLSFEIEIRYFDVLHEACPKKSIVSFYFVTLRPNLAG